MRAPEISPGSSSASAIIFAFVLLVSLWLAVVFFREICAAMRPGGFTTPPSEPLR